MMKRACLRLLLKQVKPDWYITKLMQSDLLKTLYGLRFVPLETELELLY